MAAAAPDGDSASYDYDLCCIGAGSGGVRASRMSAGFGGKVAVRPASQPAVLTWRDASCSVQSRSSKSQHAERLRSPDARPSPQVCELPFGTKASDTVGGAGGTCVIRGCVPKKLLVCVP